MPKPKKDQETGRVLIGVNSSPALRKRLEGLLDRLDVEVDRTSVSSSLRKFTDHEKGSVLIIDRAQLPDDPRPFIEEILFQDDAPALVIVTENDDSLERTQMLAAGATHILEATDSDKDLKESLSVLTENEARGGPSGPEIRGNNAQPQLSDFLSRSQATKRFVAMVERVVDVDCSLVITGETGVGKERLARAIHEAGERKGPFVGLNCGALTEALLESQLFGHVAGAFTGAKGKHKGYFEQAMGGTVFLDEVVEIPLHLQVKLLTVLQRHEVQPLGAENPVPVDVRIIAATNRDLKQEVRDGRLREDLYFRLNVIHLQIPPLRNRTEDIPDLIGHLIQFFRCDLAKTSVESISEGALDALMSYRWPGNIRELINVVERAMILSEGSEIERTDLPFDIRTGGDLEGRKDATPNATMGSEASPPPNWRTLSLKEVRDSAAFSAETAYLEAALHLHEGRISAVAKQAKIGARSLYDKMQRHHLKKEDYRAKSES